jgi:hypothetical protein
MPHNGMYAPPAGCLDVGDCMDRIHDVLKDHSGVVPVSVRYTHFLSF